MWHLRWTAERIYSLLWEHYHQVRPTSCRSLFKQPHDYLHYMYHSSALNTYRNNNAEFRAHPTWYLGKSLAASARVPFLFAFLCRAAACVFQFTNPQLVRWVGADANSCLFGILSVFFFFIYISSLKYRLLIEFMEDLLTPQWHGFFYAFLLLVNNIAIAIFMHWWLFHGYGTGQSFRSIINSCIYKKVRTIANVECTILQTVWCHELAIWCGFLMQAIRLSSVARRNTSVGEVVNLMSVDAQKLQDCPQFIHLFWSFPLLVGLSIYFLYQTLGPSAFAAIPFLAVFLPLNSFYFGQRIHAYQVRAR